MTYPGTKLIVGALCALLISISATATYAQNIELELTMEERVARLERELASLETRFEARTIEGADEAAAAARGTTLAQRLNELEQRVMRLSAELTRIERQVAAALREAAEASRQAAAAERAARHAALGR